VKIDFVISGHIHSARVGDTYGRSSSLVGANAYSEKNLNLEGRASQNIYVFYKNKTIDGIKIDLQHYDDKGYDISKELQEYAYNTKSDAKLKQGKTILKIITV
jgi:calcineurin-like phosphoesterase family protein